MNIPELESIQNISGKRVIVRVDFNVPIRDGIILDDSRIRKSLETIRFLKDAGAIVTLISHLEKGSLEPVSRHLYHLVRHEFLTGPISEIRSRVTSASAGDVFLFENLRLHEGEKKNDPHFAKELASLGDLYVNEAFSASHRNHASIVGIPEYIPACIGFQFVDEIMHLSQIFHAKKPFLFILGGAKFSTKIPLLNKYLERATDVFVGGALMNDFFRAKGYEVGTSLVSETPLDLSRELAHSALRLPSDVLVEKPDGSTRITPPDRVLKSEKIVDVGPQAIVDLHKIIRSAKTVLWNGPLGNYEAGFGEGTKELAHRIAEYKKSFSVIGGGDTAVLVYELNLESQFDFVSTGGGATLDFLANETLPGIEAIARA